MLDAGFGGPLAAVLTSIRSVMAQVDVEGWTRRVPRRSGPIPLTLARQLSEDAILKVLVTDGVDVKAVAHAGRTIPAHLRSALEV